MIHRCHAIGCKQQCRPALLMCRRHWLMVPKALKTQVLAHYRPGQEDDKAPSRNYIEAATAAIKAVAMREGREHEVSA